MPFLRLDAGYLLALAVIFLFALPFHELAHAWVAERLGDPTPGAPVGSPSIPWPIWIPSAP